MGIKGGYEILGKCGQDILIKNLSGSILVIDMMTYIVRFYKLYANKKWYKKVLEFIGNIQKYNIACICIFDGFNKPPEKRGCIQHRKNTGVFKRENLKVEILSDLEMYEKGQTEVLLQRYPGKTLPEIYDTISKTLKHLKCSNSFPTKEELKTMMIMLQATFDSQETDRCAVYIADGEAENLCCYYLKEKKADYILSEDSDVILYGATRFLMKFDGNQAKLYTIDNVLAHHNLSFQELFCLCLLLGTDYDEAGLVGYGYQRGIKYIKTAGLQKAEALVKNLDRMKEIFTPSEKCIKVTYTDEEARDAFKHLL